MDEYVRLVDRPSVADDPLLSIAEDLPAGVSAQLLIGMEAIVDVGANMERLTPGDDDSAEPLQFGGHVRVMRIRNDCMCPLLNPGDVVFLTGPETVQSGDIVVAAVDVFYRTCKIIRFTGESAYLEPTNGEGRINEDRFTVLGVVKYRLQPISERTNNTVH